MREKELRLALVCYGGVSLAVYMHGITKEVWRLARASQAHHHPDADDSGDDPYRALLHEIEEVSSVRLRVLVDIIAGASAGGINGIFLGQAISTGQSLEPLTDLWLSAADVEVLLDPDARPLSRFTKFWAVPIAWLLSGKRGGAVERTVDREQRQEVRRKLSHFVRARWFQPPFGGVTFGGLILDALDAMAATPAGPRLLPPEQPLDLFVTVTDFHGHAETLKLHSPPVARETEHRLILGFSDRRAEPRRIGEIAELVFAARATASFPGAFPPFTVEELDRLLAQRRRDWPGRDAFLGRVLPPDKRAAEAEATVLIDGSVLSNAPFGPAIAALRDRPARREVERRFVYIDPTPNRRAIRMRSNSGKTALPGFFATIFGAMADIPREQPIRDNLETIAARSNRIRRTRHVIEAIRPEVEAAIEQAFGRTLFLNRPTARRLSAWRAKAQSLAAARAGYAYASYGHFKLAGVEDDVAAMLHVLQPAHRRGTLEAMREAVRGETRRRGLGNAGALSEGGASPEAISFFQRHDLGFRIRRLRMLARQVEEIGMVESCAPEPVDRTRAAIFDALGPYLDCQIPDFYGAEVVAAANDALLSPAVAIDRLADARNLEALDKATDAALAEVLVGLPREERRTMLLAYLGFPFYDIATLPLLALDGQDEFNPILVDRIAPEDAQSIRTGGAEATLKGIGLNNFGAFFSRAYRENDYLWGRLHGAERLVDIVVSAMPTGRELPETRVIAIKQRLFRAIVAAERDRLTAIGPLIAELDKVLG